MSPGKTETIISKVRGASRTCIGLAVNCEVAEEGSRFKGRNQISVFKRNRFIDSWRISICRSGCKRLRTFSRRSGSMAARSRTSLSRVLYLEYLLKPMPTAISAEMVQTMISVPETMQELRIKKGELGSQKQAFYRETVLRCFMTIMSDNRASFSVAISRHVNRFHAGSGLVL